MVMLNLKFNFNNFKEERQEDQNQPGNMPSQDTE